MGKLVIPKPPTKPKVASPKDNFVVRPSTMAVVSRLASTDGAGRLLHGLLEFWVDTKRPVRRQHEGTTLDFLFLTTPELQSLTGMSPKQLERGFAALKASPFVLVAPKRLTVDGPLQRAIHLDQAGIWEEVNAMLNATSKVITDSGKGLKDTSYVVDKAVLPYLFKRLYERVKP